MKMNLLTSRIPFSVSLCLAAGWVVGTSTLAFGQETEGAASGARRVEERVKVEPYKGPPIFLDEVVQIAPPTVVGRTTKVDKYEGSEQVWIERQLVQYSDNHFEADGKHLEFYPDGKPFIEGQFTKGRQDGEWTYYYDNGTVNRKVTYSNGQPNGQWEVHRADGTLAAKRGFVNGQRDGEWAYYDPSGEKPLREEHYRRGKQEGVWKTWFPNGQVRQEASFKEGLKHGPSKEWDEQGKLIADVNYTDGQFDGDVIVVAPNGQTIKRKYEAGRLISEDRQ